MLNIIDINHHALELLKTGKSNARATHLPMESDGLISIINNEAKYDSGAPIPFLPFTRLNSDKERAACLEEMEKVVASGQFTSGDFITRLEKRLAASYRATACIATSSGTDALKIALKAIGVGAGDEVIVPPNSFAATENAIFSIGAKPVYANIDASFNLNPTEIPRLVTPRTKAILAVCLYGSVRNMSAISQEARHHELRVIIDAAQCFGIPDIINYGDVVTLSFNPFKNIGGFGKAGALLTCSSAIAKRARQFSYHGFCEGKKNVKAQNWGFNSRMDNIQAATLLAKLTFFALNALKRSYLAYRYINKLALLEHRGFITLPIEQTANTWHLFPIRVNAGKRDELIRFAKIMNIEFDIYYPILGYDGANEFALTYQDKISFATSRSIHATVLHIPLHNHMSLAEQDRIVGVINQFFQ
ncbi:DegT/DnrJ/EryC1/StrS family aminotransferase [Sodalis sp. RH19]|uniref:DegT/DnrJ/EryC1/StrS family aminotransferase n=1 Tax=unclassified Sodalis (in: enterobacteria) TaxID=2636512 RepID=UPI0039B58578